MKKFKTMLFFSIILLMVMTANVFAVEPAIEILGDNEAKAGDAKTVTLKITSEEDIGVFSGKVETSENITDVQVNPKNSWNLLAYENGSFKLVKTQGGKNEEALEISYKIKSDATEKATITLSGIDLTTIGYETKSVGNVTKEITIQDDNEEEEENVVSLTSIEISKAPSKVKYLEGEKFSKEGMEVKATYSDNTSKVITEYTYSPDGALTKDDKKIVITYTENNVTKTVEQEITVEKKAPANNTTTNTTNNTTNTPKQNATITIGTQNKTDNTVADKELSKAGASDIVFYMTILITSIGTIYYIKYKKINEVE